MNLLPAFNILDYRDRLEVVKELPRELHCKCPVCGDGGFKVDLTGDSSKPASYSAFKCDCSKEAIRNAIRPLAEAFKSVLPEKAVRPAQTRKWEYRSWDGQRLAAVKRIDDGKGNKQIKQGHWTGQEYKPGLPSDKRSDVALYRWAEVQKAIADNEPFIFWVEGESVADALWALGAPATTSIGGSGGYTSYGQYEGALRGSQVVVCPDMDKPGVEYARKVAKDNPGAMWLYAFPNAPQWRHLEQGTGLDLEDWVTSGATKDDLYGAIESIERSYGSNADSDDINAESLRIAVSDLAFEPDLFERAIKAKSIGSKFGVRGKELEQLVQFASIPEVTEDAGIDTLANSVYSEIERRAAGEKLPSIPSGFRDLDDKTQGFQKGDLIVLAARPAMGKTSLALAFGLKAAQIGKRIKFYSLEMGQSLLTYRLFSQMSSIEVGRLRLGRLADHEWPILSNAMSELAELPIEVTAPPLLTVERIKKDLENSAQKPEMILVDYLQFMEGPGQDVSKYTAISKGLKRLARDFDIPVLALAQLSRGVQNRTDKRPVMSDIRESGGIEQDCDLIMMLYREEYYDPDTVDRGIAEVIIAKHRNGPTGTVKLGFEAQFTRFRDLLPQMG